MKKTLQLTLLALLVYAVYCAFESQWAKGTFFLVLYHICLTFAATGYRGLAIRATRSKWAILSRTSIWRLLEMR
jgi:hypothetical protein